MQKAQIPHSPKLCSSQTGSSWTAFLLEATRQPHQGLNLMTSRLDLTKTKPKKRKYSKSSERVLQTRFTTCSQWNFFSYSIIIFFSVNFFGSGMVKKSRRASRAVTVATFTHECYFRWFVKCQQVFKINLQIEVMKRSKFLLRSCEHVNHSTAANSKQHGTGLFRYARWTSV